MEALKQGFKVLLIHSSELVEKLHSSRGDGSYNTLIKQLSELELLIIDEFYSLFIYFN